MLYHTLLYCIIRCCTVLYGAVLYCTVLYRFLLSYVVHHCVFCFCDKSVLHNNVQYKTALDCTKHNSSFYFVCTILYGALQYSTTIFLTIQSFG